MVDKAVLNDAWAKGCGDGAADEGVRTIGIG